MSKIKTNFCALTRKRNFATLLRSCHRSSRSRPRYHWSANWTSTIVTPPHLTTTTTKVTGHSLGTMFSSSSPTYQQFIANSATQCSQSSRKENVYHKRTQCERSTRTNCFSFVDYMIPPTGGHYLLLLEYLHHNRYLLLPTTNFKCWIDFSEERHFEDLGAIEDAIKTISKKLHSIPPAQAFEQFSI